MHTCCEVTTMKTPGHSLRSVMRARLHVHVPVHVQCRSSIALSLTTPTTTTRLSLTLALCCTWLSYMYIRIVSSSECMHLVLRIARSTRSNTEPLNQTERWSIPSRDGSAAMTSATMAPMKATECAGEFGQREIRYPETITVAAAGIILPGEISTWVDSECTLARV